VEHVWLDELHESYPVAVTRMPRSATACTSIEALRGPVDAIILSRGQLTKNLS